MNKYKDFEELPEDYSEQDLRNLFVKRNYSKRIENPLADDIIIVTAGINGKEIYSNLNMDVSTLKERMSFEKGTSVAYSLPETNDIESVKFEISFLKPLEIEDYYLRKRVNEYLKVCRKILNAEEKNPKKNEISEIRARAFCIALMQESGKVNFLKNKALRRNDIMTFAAKTWGGTGKTVYNECLNIISENNPINKWYKEDNPKEYELGLKIYKEMYPD